MGLRPAGGHPAATGELAYRPEIDGLRALAVLSVIAHHLAPAWLPGGYVGVDVFLVISGYLIGRLVVVAIRAQNFSLADFWGRRAKRLLPAFLLMLAASAIVAEFALPLYELRQFWGSLGSAALSASNFFFWRNTDYFGPEAAAVPLLHTWSLGVEEQFYLLFPLAALLLYRWRRLDSRRLWWALLLAALGLAALLWLWRPVAAFYLLPARAFELLAGVVIAVRQPSAPATTHGAKNWLGSVALTALLAQMFIAVESGAERFVQISLTVLCSAWLISQFNRHSQIGRLLSLGPMRRLGQASYSLYLWHLPVLVLLPFLLPSTPAWAMGLLVLVLGLASHRFVEQPLRYAPYLPQRPALAVGLGLMLACASYAGLRHAWHGLPRPPSPDQRAVLTQGYDYASDYELGRCFLAPEMSVQSLQTCRLPGRAAATDTALLWGDSHAAHLLPGLRIQSKRQAGNWQSLTHWAVAGCAPQLNMASRYRDDCAAVNQTLLGRAAALRPQLVILAADWLAAPTNELAPLVRQLRALGAKRIVVIGPVPRWKTPLPYLLAQHSTQLQSMPTRLDEQALDPRLWSMDQRLRTEAAALGLDYLSALGVLCNGKACRTRSSELSAELTSWDEAHLRPQASAQLAEALIALVDATGPRAAQDAAPSAGE